MEKVLFSFDIGKYNFQVHQVAIESASDRGKLLLRSPVLKDDFDLKIAGPGTSSNGLGEATSQISFSLSNLSEAEVTLVILDECYGYYWTDYSFDDVKNHFDSKHKYYVLINLLNLDNDIVCHVKKLPGIKAVKSISL